MFALALLFPMPDVPLVPGAGFTPEAQWRILAACPFVGVAGGHSKGSGVVIAERDGFGYILTAAHVVPFDGLDIQFYTRAKYPKLTWRATDAQVIKRWSPDVDMALIRFALDKHDVAVLPLAPPGRRPRSFPFPVLSVGGVSGQPPTIEADTILAKRLVRSREEPEKVAFFWETAQPSRKGRSGGPLLDPEGRVIGLCDATQGGRGYFIHLDEIWAALARDPAPGVSLDTFRQARTAVLPTYHRSESD